MSEIRKLHTFMDLARLGTVAAVAESRAYSTSAVSQQISRLEADLGVELVEPHGRRLRLTPAGRVLAELAPAVLDIWESTRSAVAGSVAETRGVVTMASFQTAYLTIVPSVITALGERLPLLEPALHSSRAGAGRPRCAVPRVRCRNH